METQIYNQQGKKVSTINLPESVFGLPFNADLVHQVVVGIQSNKRAGTANAKDRSAVSGGGKKPWKQKGTGRARHGSTRSPLWIGGGVTHGPLSEKDYSKKINKKMKAKALYCALSAKMKDGKIAFLDTLAFSQIKTKEAKDVLESISAISGFETMTKNRTRKTAIVIPERNITLIKSLSNIPSVEVFELKNISVIDVLSKKHVVFVSPEVVCETLAKKIIGGSKTTEKK